MPEVVVDPLEGVDVEEHQCQGPAVAEGASHLPLQELDQVAAVARLGQAVHDRERSIVDQSIQIVSRRIDETGTREATAPTDASIDAPRPAAAS